MEYSKKHVTKTRNTIGAASKTRERPRTIYKKKSIDISKIKRRGNSASKNKHSQLQSGNTFSNMMNTTMRKYADHKKHKRTDMEENW